MGADKAVAMGCRGGLSAAVEVRYCRTKTYPEASDASKGAACRGSVQPRFIPDRHSRIPLGSKTRESPTRLGSAAAGRLTRHPQRRRGPHPEGSPPLEPLPSPQLGGVSLGIFLHQAGASRTTPYKTAFGGGRRGNGNASGIVPGNVQVDVRQAVTKLGDRRWKQGCKDVLCQTPSLRSHGSIHDLPDRGLDPALKRRS